MEASAAQGGGDTAPPAGSKSGFGKWSVVLALASAQFIMVLDSTVMNVSIEDVIDDLDTTVAKMQLAIASYTLVTAALMMLGGKIGDIIGRRRAFRIGLVTFGLGAGITSIAPSIGVLILGWSIIEAIGAALMLPAVASLISSNYQGRERAISFGIVGGVIGVAAAAGPIIGGWASTALSWRVVFAAEVFIALGLLAASHVIRDSHREGPPPKLDKVGALLSVLGLGLAVLGIVQSTEWGWIEPKDALTLFGTEITPFGLSVVPFLIVIGIALVGCFVLWEQRLTRRGIDTLLKLSMLDIPQLRSGLSSMLVMMFTMGGVFFVLPLYLQIVLGKDPLQTGVHILPLSLAVLFTSLIASRLSSRVAPRRIVRIGIGLIVLGTLLLLVSMDLTFHRAELNIAMAIVGVGMGCMASQLANVNLSSVGEHDSSEVGGLQGTAQNLGTALGTAIIGSILLTALLNAFDHKIANNPQIAAQTRSEVSQHTEKGIEFVPVGPAKEQLLKSGVPASQADQLASDYADAQVDALKIALGGVAFIVLLSFPVTRKLPSEPLNAPGPGAAAV